MKKVVVLVALILLFTGCSNNDNSDASSIINENNAEVQDQQPQTSEMEKQMVMPVDNEVQENVNILPDDEIKELCNRKCGYGQGVQINKENAPYGAIDFNNEFSKYNALAIGEKEKVIYLTFDQGYENGYTTKILDTLKQNDVKATFFIIADYENRNSELVKRMIDEGHMIGNHSYHHYSMPDLDIVEARNEIVSLHDKVREKYNYEMTVFRPPMGEYSEMSLAITQSCGYKTVLWSFAYADWDANKQMDCKKALNKLTNAAHCGAIYLLHSVSCTNAEVLDSLIKDLKNQGYEFKLF